MIQIERLQKVVGQQTELDIESLAVAPGEVAALLSGAGGSEPLDLLLDLLLGRLRPTLGTVRVAGLDPVRAPQHVRARCGVLFADNRLYERQTVAANLRLFARLYRLPAAQVAATLALVGLADQANVRVDRLGPGLARRLAFGRAILHRPDVLLVVEPFADCDKPTMTLLGDRVRQLADDGAAVLILAREAPHLGTVCDMFHVLEAGRLVESYAPEDAAPSDLPFKIPVRGEGSVILLNPGDILYASVDEGQVLIHTAEGPLVSQFALGELEDRLARSGFFRTHRGYLVNLQHVREIIPYTRNSFNIRLDDGSQIPLSKAAAAELRTLLGY
jgi:ABC-2 type transport system ATP-binding protein